MAESTSPEQDVTHTNYEELSFHDEDLHLHMSVSDDDHDIFSGQMSKYVEFVLNNPLTPDIAVAHDSSVELIDREKEELSASATSIESVLAEDADSTLQMEVKTEKGEQLQGNEATDKKTDDNATAVPEVVTVKKEVPTGSGSGEPDGDSLNALLQQKLKSISAHDLLKLLDTSKTTVKQEKRDKMPIKKERVTPKTEIELLEQPKPEPEIIELLDSDDDTPPTITDKKPATARLVRPNPAPSRSSPVDLKFTPVKLEEMRRNWRTRSPTTIAEASQTTSCDRVTVATQTVPRLVHEVQIQTDMHMKDSEVSSGLVRDQEVATDLLLSDLAHIEVNTETVVQQMAKKSSATEDTPQNDKEATEGIKKTTVTAPLPTQVQGLDNRSDNIARGEVERYQTPKITPRVTEQQEVLDLGPRQGITMTPTGFQQTMPLFSIPSTPGRTPYIVTQPPNVFPTQVVRNTASMPRPAHMHAVTSTYSRYQLPAATSDLSSDESTSMQAMATDSLYLKPVQKATRSRGRARPYSGRPYPRQSRSSRTQQYHDEPFSTPTSRREYDDDEPLTEIYKAYKNQDPDFLEKANAKPVQRQQHAAQPSAAELYLQNVEKRMREEQAEGDDQSQGDEEMVITQNSDFSSSFDSPKFGVKDKALSEVTVEDNGSNKKFTLKLQVDEPGHDKTAESFADAPVQMSAALSPIRSANPSPINSGDEKILDDGLGEYDEDSNVEDNADINDYYADQEDDLNTGEVMSTMLEKTEEKPKAATTEMTQIIKPSKTVNKESTARLQQTSSDNSKSTLDNAKDKKTDSELEVKNKAKDEKKVGDGKSTQDAKGQDKEKTSAKEKPKEKKQNKKVPEATSQEDEANKKKKASAVDDKSQKTGDGKEESNKSAEEKTKPKDKKAEKSEDKKTGEEVQEKDESKGDGKSPQTTEQSTPKKGKLPTANVTPKAKDDKNVGDDKSTPDAKGKDKDKSSAHVTPKATDRAMRSTAVRGVDEGGSKLKLPKEKKSSKNKQDLDKSSSAFDEEDNTVEDLEVEDSSEIEVSTRSSSAKRKKHGGGKKLKKVRKDGPESYITTTTKRFQTKPLKKYHMRSSTAEGDDSKDQQDSDYSAHSQDAAESDEESPQVKSELADLQRIEVRRQNLRNKKKTDIDGATFYTNHRDRLMDLRDLLHDKYPRVPEMERTTIMKGMGRKVITVKKDGNGMFHAIANQTPDYSGAKDLKSEMCHFLGDNRPLFEYTVERQITEGDKTMKLYKYCDEMENTLRKGDELSAVVIAFMLQRNITIVTPKNTWKYEPEEPHDIVILYTGTNIYYSSCPIERRSRGAEDCTNSLNRKFSCWICKKLLSTNELLIEHKKSHAKREYRCDKCFKCYASNYYLKQHVNAIHNNQLVQCTFENCDKTFQTTTSMKSHLKLHTYQYKYTCDQCGKGFLKKDHFEVHIARHNNERKYKCSKCAKCFLSKADLIRHVTNCGNVERTCRCPVCGKMFKSKATLRGHRKSVHEEGIEFTCPYCPEFKSYYRATIDRHVKKYHKAKKD